MTQANDSAHHLRDLAEQRGSDIVRHLDEAHAITCRPEHGLSLADVLRLHEDQHPETAS